MTQTARPLNGSERSHRGRFTSPQAELEESVVDYQVDLEELAKKHTSLADEQRAEIARDEADDRRRFLKYRAVEHAIRRGDQSVALEAFHQLVAHVEADEMREDEVRLGTEGALRLLAAKSILLRTIFREDFVPRIIGAFVAGRRSA